MATRGPGPIFAFPLLFHRKKLNVALLGSRVVGGGGSPSTSLHNYMKHIEFELQINSMLPISTTRNQHINC
ncbi:hypothetical protein UPYG_G00272440 [Umbra pygmaea]|uniref:Uncharacterized protein n=1 Tax=Umbra pygmaea TaxID=75934 RepID=A0ABD0WB25_UMBPY